MSARRAIATRIAVGMLALGVTGCASTSSELRGRVADARAHAAARPRSSATTAAVSRVRAAEASRDSHPWVPNARIAVNGVSGEHLQEGQGIALVGTVYVAAPWDVAQQVEAGQHGVEAAVDALEAVDLEQAGVTCLRGVRASAILERTQAASELRAILAEVLAWTGALEEGRVLDGLELARARMTLARAASETVVPPLLDDTPPLALPSLRTDRSALERDPAEVAAWIDAHHPRVDEARSRAAQYAAFAERERLRPLPWIDYVRARYEAGATDAGALELSVALSVPLDARSGAASESYDALADASRHDGEAVIDALVLRALDALAVLAHFRAQTATWVALAENATVVDATAREWLARGEGSPLRVADALLEAYRSRMAVLDARTLAAEAACNLYAATGTTWDAWPTGE